MGSRAHTRVWGASLVVEAGVLVVDCRVWIGLDPRRAQRPGGVGDDLNCRGVIPETRRVWRLGCVGRVQRSNRRMWSEWGVGAREETPPGGPLQEKGVG